MGYTRRMANPSPDQLPLPFVKESPESADAHSEERLHKRAAVPVARRPPKREARVIHPRSTRTG